MLIQKKLYILWSEIVTEATFLWVSHHDSDKISIQTLIKPYYKSEMFKHLEYLTVLESIKNFTNARFQGHLSKHIAIITISLMIVFKW